MRVVQVDPAAIASTRGATGRGWRAGASGRLKDDKPSPKDAASSREPRDAASNGRAIAPSRPSRGPRGREGESTARIAHDRARRRPLPLEHVQEGPRTCRSGVAARRVEPKSASTVSRSTSRSRMIEANAEEVDVVASCDQVGRTISPARGIRSPVMNPTMVAEKSRPSPTCTIGRAVPPAPGPSRVHQNRDGHHACEGSGDAVLKARPSSDQSSPLKKKNRSAQRKSPSRSLHRAQVPPLSCKASESCFVGSDGLYYMRWDRQTLRPAPIREQATRRSVSAGEDADRATRPSGDGRHGLGDEELPVGVPSVRWR